MSPDEATIRAFIIPSRRPRWLESVVSAKRRARFLDRLNHCRDIDERYATSLASTVDAAHLLRSRGAPGVCYVISDNNTLDGRELALEEAIEAIENGGWGTIVSCLPGRLAYYYDECGERRMLLERKVNNA